MYRYSDLTIRKFTAKDVADKVRWINDPRTNAYLHYDLPLTEEKTLEWYERVKDREDRFDAVIEYEGTPVGLCGLLGIDRKNGKAECYTVIGNLDLRGKGLATRARRLLHMYAFECLGLNKVCSYTEVDNIPSQKMNARLGLKIEGRLAEDVCKDGKYIDRYVLGLLRRDNPADPDIYEEKD